MHRTATKCDEVADPPPGGSSASEWALSSFLSLAVHVVAILLLATTATFPAIPGPKGGSINVRILGAPGPLGAAPAPPGPMVVAAPETVPVVPPAPVTEKAKAPKLKARVEKKKTAVRPAVARKRPAKESPPVVKAEESRPSEAQFAAASGPPAEVASAVSGNGGPGGGGGSPGTGGGSGGGHGSGSGQVEQDSRWTKNLLAELRRQLEARKRYPRSARVRREEGTVVLRALLSSSGTVRNWEIAQASPFPSLDDAALNAARGIQALRAKGYDDPPLEVSVVVPMRFSLSAIR